MRVQFNPHRRGADVGRGGAAAIGRRACDGRCTAVRVSDFAVESPGSLPVLCFCADVCFSSFAVCVRSRGAEAAGGSSRDCYLVFLVCVRPCHCDTGTRIDARDLEVHESAMARACGTSGLMRGVWPDPEQPSTGDRQVWRDAEGRLCVEGAVAPIRQAPAQFCAGPWHRDDVLEGDPRSHVMESYSSVDVSCLD